MLTVHKMFRLADRLAACCLAVLFCAAPALGVAGEAGDGRDATPAVRKKIALVQFDVANTLHVDDISNIYDGLPSLLAQRIAAGGEFLADHTGRSIPPEAGEAQREAIVQIAGEAGAQFLVSGMVVNAGTKQEKGYLGTPIGRSAKRHIEVELAIHEGLTGVRLLTLHLDEEAQGEVKVGNDKPFGSSAFLETEFGQAVSRLADVAVREIRGALREMPFSAHIVRVEGKRVFLDAGGDARLKPGDRLVAYVSDARISGLKGTMLGVTDHAEDIIVLTQVQPQFAIGELTQEAAKHGIRAGHVARIDPAGERELEARQLEALQAARAQEAARREAERAAREQAAQAQAQLLRAEQAAQVEAARAEAQKEAKAQADAEAKAAKLKAAQEAKAVRLSAAQEARAREEAQAARAAARAKRKAAEAEAARAKAEKKAQAGAKAKAAAEAKAASQKTEQDAGAKAAQPKAEAAPAGKKPARKDQPRAEIRAVAIEDLQRAQAEAALAKPEAAASAPPENKKPGVPLKLKEIKP